MNTAMAIVRTDLICEGSSARVDRHVESEMTVRHRTLVAIELGRPYVDHPILLPQQGPYSIISATGGPAIAA
jgi:hypothetical protein